MGTHILVKWGPLAVEMGANWGPKKRIFDNLTETSKFIEDGASKDAQIPSYTLLLLLLRDQNPQMGTNGGAVGWYCWCGKPQHIKQKVKFFSLDWNQPSNLQPTLGRQGESGNAGVKGTADTTIWSNARLRLCSENFINWVLGKLRIRFNFHDFLNIRRKNLWGGSLGIQNHIFSRSSRSCITGPFIYIKSKLWLTSHKSIFLTNMKWKF